MLPRWANIFFYFIAGINFLFAQNSIEKQFHFADSLFKSQNYFDAITEYKRAIYFDKSGQNTYYANYKIGICYKAGAKFEEAIKYFSVCATTTTDNEKIFKSKIEIVRSNILRKTITRAIKLTQELEEDLRFASKKNEIIYWRGWAYMLGDDWKLAEKSFSDINENELTSLCRQVESQKVSVTFAKVISYILPGSGQLYSGQLLSGLMSLAWNVFAGYLTIDAFIAERAFDGIVTADLLWLRFYRGNVQNAEKFAEEKNIEVANRALKYLQNDYKGIKP